MYLKNVTLIIALISILFVSCNDSTNESDVYKELNYQMVSSYFVKNTVEDGEFYLILKNKNDFDEHFHYFGTTEDTLKIYETDFVNNYVIAVLKPISGLEYQFHINKIVVSNDKIKFDYTSEITDTMTFNMHGYLMAKVEKVEFKTLEFYENNKLVKSIENY